MSNNLLFVLTLQNGEGRGATTRSLRVYVPADQTIAPELMYRLTSQNTSTPHAICGLQGKGAPPVYHDKRKPNQTLADVVAWATSGPWGCTKIDLPPEENLL